MYVRLKHTLSSLALEMLQRAPRLRPIAWLLGYVRLAPHGDPVPLEALRREAETIGPAGPRGLARMEGLGILQRAKRKGRRPPARYRRGGEVGGVRRVLGGDPYHPFHALEDAERPQPGQSAGAGRADRFRFPP